MERSELEALAGNLPSLQETREVCCQERDAAAAHLETLDNNLASLDRRIAESEKAVKILKGAKHSTLKSDIRPSSFSSARESTPKAEADSTLKAEPKPKVKKEK